MRVKNQELIQGWDDTDFKIFYDKNYNMWFITLIKPVIISIFIAWLIFWGWLFVSPTITISATLFNWFCLPSLIIALFIYEELFSHWRKKYQANFKLLNNIINTPNNIIVNPPVKHQYNFPISNNLNKISLIKSMAVSDVIYDAHHRYKLYTAREDTKNYLYQVTWSDYINIPFTFHENNSTVRIKIIKDDKEEKLTLIELSPTRFLNPTVYLTQKHFDFLYQKS